MAVKPPKRRSERLSRRKSTLINMAHELAEFCDVDVALIIRNRQTGRYFTYNSVDLASWPPSKEQIQLSYPVPVNLLPCDLEARRGNLKHRSRSKRIEQKVKVERLVDTEWEWLDGADVCNKSQITKGRKKFDN